MGFCLFNNVAVAAEAARRLGRRAGADRRLGRAPRQRHPAPLREPAGRAVHVRRTSTRSTRAPARPTRSARARGRASPSTAGCRRADRRRLRGRVRGPVPAHRRGLPAAIWSWSRPASMPTSAIRWREMRVTERGFAAMCTAVRKLAEAHAQGRLVLLLEGGYDLAALAAFGAGLPGGAHRARTRASPAACTGPDRRWPTAGPPGAVLAAAVSARERLAEAGRWLLPGASGPGGGASVRPGVRSGAGDRLAVAGRAGAAADRAATGLLPAARHCSRTPGCREGATLARASRRCCAGPGAGRRRAAAGRNPAGRWAGLWPW